MRPIQGGPSQAALASLAALRARVAVLDRHGVVIWCNPLWSKMRQRQGGDSLTAVAVGLNYVSLCRRSTHRAGLAIAEGVLAVLGEASRYLELETEFAGLPGRRTQITVTPAPDMPKGGVLVQTDVFGAPAPENARGSIDRAPEPADHMPVDLTPRERQVLSLMARGHGNPEIAAELELGYTTVRAHVRSLMSKLDARSRLEAVVRAVDLGLVDLPGPGTTQPRDQGAGPRDR